MSDVTLAMAREIAALRARIERLERLETPRFIGARATTDAGQSIPTGALTVVNYEDVVYDPLGLITVGAGWVFTVPIAGQYLVNAAVLFDATAGWAIAEQAELFLSVNGSVVYFLDRKDNQSGGGQFLQLSGSGVVELAAGDTMNVRITQASGAALALNPDTRTNYVNISRLG